MNSLFTFIGKILAWIWKTISFTRQLILNLIFIGFILGIYYLFTAEQTLRSSRSVPPKEKQALLLNLSGPIVEKTTRIAPFDLATQSLFNQQAKIENQLYTLVEKIRAAAKDQNINGLVLDLNDMHETSLTKLRYIAKAIEQFKETGKEVIAIGAHYNQSQYYLSSYADEIYMSPYGAVLLPGYGSYSLYFKDLLEKLKVNTHVFRVGTYKSFVEPYTRSEMSEEARLASSVWLNQLWEGYLSDVAINRGTSIEVFSPTADIYVSELTSVDGDFAQLALKMGLVNSLLTRPQIRTELAKKFGKNEKNSFNYVSIYDYSLPQLAPLQENQIAVIVASGAIMDGKETNGTAGGDSIASLLRQARLNDKIKAVILRIDSPGGSVFASEVIRNEVEMLKTNGKPIIASMSSIAASGGYWIASSANRIIAQPTTITGSIGVFGILTTFEKTLAQYGVYNDGVGTTPFAGIGLTRALPEQMGKIMQLSVESTYKRFIDLVSTQRKMPFANVETVAQGRVWTGTDAMKYGLIDQLGDFDDAITAAAELAKIETYSLNWMKEDLTPAERFINNYFLDALSELNLSNSTLFATASKLMTSPLVKEVERFSLFNDPTGQYALCSKCNYHL